MVTKLLKAKDFIAEKIMWAFLCLFGAWLLFALSFMFYSLYLEFTDNEQALQQISNEFSWKFDGTFKNSPDNIWYDADKQVTIESVTNEVKIGKLAGNRKLEFGVKNILEEYLQDKGYNLSSSAPNKVSVQIIFLDVLTTKKNISVFHSVLRRAPAKVRPISARVCTWLAPGTSYSIGSSIVTMRMSGELIACRKALSVVDLPEPVGPVTRMMPCG